MLFNRGLSSNLASSRDNSGNESCLPKNIHGSKSFFGERKSCEERKNTPVPHCQEKNMDRLYSLMSDQSGMKYIKSRIKEGVNIALSQADRDLDVRRGRLRELLQAEESNYEEEYRKKLEESEKERMNKMLMNLNEKRLKEEAERLALAEEKRIQQFRNRSNDLLLTIHNRNRKLLNDVHDLQIKDKLEQEKRRREQELLYNRLVERDTEEKREGDRREEIERQYRIKELTKIFDQQLEEKKAIEKEQHRLKMEEAKLADQLRVQIQKEKEEEKEKGLKARQKCREEMEEQLKISREIQERRRNQEKEIDKAFCDLIQYELDKEKSANIDHRRQMRREMDLFKAYLDERKFQQQESKNKTMQLFQKEKETIELEQDKLQMLVAAAKEELQQEVFKERARQLEEKEQKAREEREKKALEEMEEKKKYREMEELERERKLQKETEKKMYGKYLKEQEMEKKLIMEKNRRAEESKLQKDLMREEQYLKKAESLFLEGIGTKKHPFMRKFEFCP